MQNYSSKLWSLDSDSVLEVFSWVSVSCARPAHGTPSSVLTAFIEDAQAQDARWLAMGTWWGWDQKSAILAPEQSLTSALDVNVSQGLSVTTQMRLRHDSEWKKPESRPTA